MSIIRIFNSGYGASRNVNPNFAEENSAPDVSRVSQPSLEQTRNVKEGGAPLEFGAEAERVRSEYQEFIDLLQRSVGRLGTMRDEYQAKAVQLVEIKAQNESYHAALTRIEAEHAQISSDHEALRSDYEALEVQRDRLAAQCDDLETERADLISVREQFIALRDAHNELQATSERIQRAYQDLSQRYDGLKFESAELEKTLYQEQERKRELEEMHARTDAQRLTEIDHLNEALSSLSRKAMALEASLEEARSGWDAEKTSAARLGESLQQLRSEHAAVNANSLRAKKQYMQELSEIKEALSKEKYKTELLEEKNQKLIESSERAVKREQDLRDEAFQLRLELKNLKNDNYEKEKNIKSIISDRDSIKVATEDYKQQIFGLQAEIDRLTQDIVALRTRSEHESKTQIARIARLEDDQGEQKSVIETLTKEKSSLTMERDALRSERALIIGQLSHYRNRATESGDEGDAPEEGVSASLPSLPRAHEFPLDAARPQVDGETHNHENDDPRKEPGASAGT